MTTRRIIRSAGLAAVVAGLLFVAIQPIHPDDSLASVTTSMWLVVHSATLVMTTLFMVGITGIYARQVGEMGWLGLTGLIVLGFGLALTSAFVFVEAFVEPQLAGVAPGFVEDLLRMVEGSGPPVQLGALPILWSASGLFFMVGSVAFGIAVLRAGILPRWASALFAFGLPVSAVVISLLPLDLHRLGAMPMGFGLAGMGYALWSERRDSPEEAARSNVPRPRQPAAG